MLHYCVYEDFGKSGEGVPISYSTNFVSRLDFLLKIVQDKK